MESSHLFYTYPQNKTGLIDVSFQIKPGTITAVVGPNGSGKSTLFKLLSRELVPNQGSVYLDGRAITDYSNKAYARKVAVVHQKNILYDDISVIDLVRFGRLPYNSLTAVPNDDQINFILDYLELKPIANQNMLALSGGQQQRVWLAMALAQEPKYLLLDEPTTYLDLHYQSSFMALLRKLNKELNLTIIMIVHDLNHALHFSEQVIMLQRGKIVTTGTPAAVLTTERIAAVFDINTQRVTTDQGEFIVQLPMDLA